MKKLILSTISLVTSAVILICSGSVSAFATDADTVGSDSVSAELTLSDLDAFTVPFTEQAKILSNFSDGFYNYGDFLEGNNLAVYQTFMELDEPTNESIVIKLPQTVTVKLSTLPNRPNFTDADKEKYQDALFGNCKPGIDSALFDRPELYWIDPNSMSVAVGTDTSVTSDFFTGGYTLKIRSLVIMPALLSAFTSKTDALNYGKLLDEALEKVPVTGDSRYEQLKNIHDYISKSTYYDLSAKFSSSALGALVEPGVVCEGYSEAFKLICDRLGIPCICVFGNLIEEENAGHMWNYVLMDDGKWYGVDVTWDDLDGAGGREVKHEYFLKGSDSFFVKHTPVTDYKITALYYPEISKSDYSLPSHETSTTTTTTTTTSKTTTTTKKLTTTTTSKTTTTTKKLTTTTTSKATTTTKKLTTTTTSKTTTTTKKLTTTTTTSTAPPQPLIGDLNRDGSVNVADLVYCQSYLLGKIKVKYPCDPNNDGSPDVFDLIYMRKLLIR